MALLKTARLILRPPRLSDADAIQSYFDDWEVIRWLRPPVPWPYPADGALVHLQRLIPEQGKSTYTFMLTFEEQDIVIGAVDMRLKEDEHGLYGERGFSLSRAYWGQGLMQEATVAVNAFLFQRTDAHKIVSYNAPDNTRSIRIQERQGFHYIGRIDTAIASHSGHTEQDRWELTRDNWSTQQK